MCDPTGISETAIAASLTEAGAAAAASSAVAAAGTVTAGAATVAAAAAPAAAGIFGTGISGSTALGLAGTGLSTGLSMMGRMAAASSNAGLYIQNALNQNRALAQNYNGLSLRQSQLADQTATANFDILRGLAKATGKANAAAGEAGVGGVSLSDVLSDLRVRDAMATGKNDANYTAGIEQAQDEKEAAKSRTVANIAGMPQTNSLGLYAGLGADAITGGLKIYDLADKGGVFKALSGGADTPTGTTT